MPAIVGIRPRNVPTNPTSRRIAAMTMVMPGERAGASFLESLDQRSEDKQHRRRGEQTPRHELFGHPRDDLTLQVVGQRAEATDEGNGLRLEEHERKTD